MWFTAETIARLQNLGPMTPQDPNNIQKERDAVKAIEDAGKGICLFCEEEIVKNETLAAWESEILLAYCPEGREHRHKPLIRYSVTEGIINDERNATADAEPLQDEDQCD